MRQQWHRLGLSIFALLFSQELLFRFGKVHITILPLNHDTSYIQYTIYVLHICGRKHTYIIARNTYIHSSNTLLANIMPCRSKREGQQYPHNSRQRSFHDDRAHTLCSHMRCACIVFSGSTASLIAHMCS